MLIVQKIFTDDVPFHQLKHDGAIVIALLKGKRPIRPSPETANATGLSDPMWALMGECWRESPSERPTSTQIVETIALFPSAKADEFVSNEWISLSSLRQSYFLTENPFANELLGRIQEYLST